MESGGPASPSRSRTARSPGHLQEVPQLGKTAEGSLLEGNAVTVEPGVYVPGTAGVRIEDLVIVTDGDPRVLTGFPKGLVTVA